MKVENDTIQEFIDVLKGIESNEATEGKVLHNIVYMQRAEDPLNGDARSATSRRVFFNVSCIVINKDSSEILAVAQEECGIDRRTDGGSFEGSEKYAELHKILQVFTEERGYTLLPGQAQPV